ncbi:MAG: hypothetical protein SF339_12670 [Blastocatellia bacterium]|nr:hypothetical protein [Blastocatellia bacterium]
MNTEVQELYTQTVRQWPPQEQLQLAAMILDELARAQFAVPARVLSDEQKRAALAELLRHAGAVKSGSPHSGDNESIDADLAREYGRDLSCPI